jgi:hypothetical protein
LEAAHLYEIHTHDAVKKEERLAEIIKVDLYDVNHPNNLITLCQQCHKFFDKKGGYKIGIEPGSHTLMIAESIREKPTLKEGIRYQDLHGKPIVFNGGPSNHPSELVIEQRYTFFNRKGKKGRQMHYCNNCLTFCSSKNELTTHQNSCRKI